MAAAARRNLELKARDPDPAATLRAALDAGARDHGVLRQCDTYFGAPPGRRLKLREQEPGGAQLIAYDRADEASARESRYRLVDVPDADALREALAAALGVTVVVEKRRRLLLVESVRNHLDAVEGLGSFVELEAVVPDGAATEAEASRVARLRRRLRIDDERLEPHGYAQLVLRDGAVPGAGGHARVVTEPAPGDGTSSAGGRAPTAGDVAQAAIVPRAHEAALSGDVAALVDAARQAMSRAYAPYSRFSVGAALRDERGDVHAGANVENSSYPQGQCAETSAIGALIVAGGTRITEVAVMADTELVTPCGGCRQRLSEFAGVDTLVHLCGPEGVRRTVTLGELLPLSFGAADLPA